MKRLCKRLKVPRDCCYIEFMPKQSRPLKGKIKTAYKYSLDSVPVPGSQDELSLETCRGEQLIIDFDKNDKVIGIELLSSKKARKPCQN